METMPIMMLNGLGCSCQEQAQPTMFVNGLGSYGKQINWDTQPVINTYPYNRDGYWDCNDWMTWHKKVAEKYGVSRANEVFLIWWNKQSFYNYAMDCMLLNKTFRDYFNSVGLPLDNLANYIAKPFDFVLNTQDTVLTSGENVIKSGASAAEDLAQGAASTANVAKYAVPLLVGGLALGVGYYVYKNYLKGNKKVKVGPLGGPPKKRRTKKKK